MGKIDDEFMENLGKARNLMPKIQKLLNGPGDIPDDLDHPTDQEEVDNLYAFGVELALLISQLDSLGAKLCVWMSVQEALHSPEEEEGMTLDEKYADLCLRRDMF